MKRRMYSTSAISSSFCLEVGGKMLPEAHSARHFAFVKRLIDTDGLLVSPLVVRIV